MPGRVVPACACWAADCPGISWPPPGGWLPPGRLGRRIVLTDALAEQGRPPETRGSRGRRERARARVRRAATTSIGDRGRGGGAVRPRGRGHSSAGRPMRVGYLGWYPCRCVSRARSATREGALAQATPLASPARVGAPIVPSCRPSPASPSTSGSSAASRSSARCSQAGASLDRRCGLPGPWGIRPLRWQSPDLVKRALGELGRP